MKRATVVAAGILMLLVACVRQETWSERDPVRASAANPYLAVLQALRDVTGDMTYFVRAADAETQAALVEASDQLRALDMYTDAAEAGTADTIATVTFSNSIRRGEEYEGEVYALWLDAGTMRGATKTETYHVRCSGGSCRAELRFKSEGVIVPPPAAPDSSG